MTRLLTPDSIHLVNPLVIKYNGTKTGLIIIGVTPTTIEIGCRVPPYIFRWNGTSFKHGQFFVLTLDGWNYINVIVDWV